MLPGSFKRKALRDKVKRFNVGKFAQGSVPSGVGPGTVGGSGMKPILRSTSSEVVQRTMSLELTRIRYVDLNSRQKENYNFQKVSAVLADFGFVTLRLTDDWQGADFIAQHIDGETFLRVQLKGRLTFSRKYLDKDLYIAFEQKGTWYRYPHDELLRTIIEEIGIIAGTRSWEERGNYSIGTLSRQLEELLEPYRIADHDLRVGNVPAERSPHS